MKIKGGRYGEEGLREGGLRKEGRKSERMRERESIVTMKNKQQISHYHLYRLYI